MTYPIYAILSIHDVSPASIEQVKTVIKQIPVELHRQITLLVIPGGDWQKEELQQLRQWQHQGFELAGHGWSHSCHSVKSWYHRLHSLLISRDVAEHLTLNEEQITQLITRTYQWFIDNQLAPPSAYVPPAWAMGRISRTRLRTLPFRYYEYARGIYDAKKDVFKVLPLVGFEADNVISGLFLRCWNWLNRLATGRSHPLRLSIHPFDNHLMLAQSLKKTLHQPIALCSIAESVV